MPSASWQKSWHFYPRPPRGGRLAEAISYIAQNKISIHALREEGDSRNSLTTSEKRTFLSTPSARRATHLSAADLRWLDISIHALREEGDQGMKKVGGSDGYFYPRPPRGGRPAPPPEHFEPLGISIHALREEGDAF